MFRRALIGLIAIAVLVFGVSMLHTSGQQTPTTGELSVAKKVCDSVNKIMENTSYDGDPLVVSDCVEPDRTCERMWGPHAVWEGLSDSDNVPICVCDTLYQWAADGSGKCVRQ